MVADTVRVHRVAIAAWIGAGSIAMYVIALSLSSEMKRFAGGPQAFADSLRGGVEAMRPLRWPADRLDTLGGYLWYHNVTLVTLFLAIYSAMQGARAIRGGEDGYSLEEILATGHSRAAVICDRAAGFAVTLALVSLGLGLGVAVSLAAVGESDAMGSLVTMTAVGLAAFVAYCLGLLVSQLTATSRAAAGITAIILSVLYLLTNVSGELGAAGAVRYLSPFEYANASRAIVPGHHLDVVATVVLAAAAVGLLALAASAFQRRDYRAALWNRPPRPTPANAPVQRPSLRRLWTATLVRGRFGLLAWSLATATYLAFVAALEPSVIDAWKAFESYVGIAGGRPGIAPEQQYLALAAEIVTPIITAYVVTQAAAWVAELDQGRVEAYLAAPVTWTRLVIERLVATTVAVAAVTVSAFIGLVAAATAVGAHVDAVGLARVGVGCLLLGAAVAAVAALVVAVLRTTRAVLVVTLFVVGSYLLYLLVPLLDWPAWVNSTSIFGAFGHPYLQGLPFGGTLVLLTVAAGGTILASRFAERSPKVA